MNRTTDSVRGLLYRYERAVGRHRATIARSLGLTDSEMLTLIHLAEETELSPSRIALLLDLSSGGTTALIQRLERAGHVTRRPNPDDGRGTLLELSPNTAALLAEGEQALTEGLEAALTSLGEPEAVVAFLEQLVERSEAAVAGPGTAGTAERSRPVPSLWA